MKKLMIAAVIVCTAAFAQAALYKWQATMVYDGYAGGSAPAAGDAYLFLNAGSTDLATIQAAVQAGTFSAADYLDTTAFTAGTINKTSAEGLDGVTGDSFFMVLVANQGGTDYAYISPTYTPAVVETIGATTLSFVDNPSMSMYGLYTSTADSGKWYEQGSSPIPEPTSGLLLLLGVAGLALKRRRA